MSVGHFGCLCTCSCRIFENGTWCPYKLLLCLFILREVVNFFSMMHAQYHYNSLVLPCYVCDNDPPVSMRDNITIFSTFCPCLYNCYTGKMLKIFFYIEIFSTLLPMCPKSVVLLLPCQ